MLIRMLPRVRLARRGHAPDVGRVGFELGCGEALDWGLGWFVLFIVLFDNIIFVVIVVVIFIVVVIVIVVKDVIVMKDGIGKIAMIKCRE